MKQGGLHKLLPLLALSAAAAAQSAGPQGGKVTRYVAPEQQTSVCFGARSALVATLAGELETCRPAGCGRPWGSI